MLIPYSEVAASIATENPWWQTGAIPKRFAKMRRRVYFDPLHALVSQWHVNRAIILLGPRRVGKTVMTYHLVDRLIGDGFDPSRIMYVSIDTPTYTKQSLQSYLDYHTSAHSIKPEERRVVIFDEIQYLPDWERHLKVLVDRYPSIRFIASGSAAAALKLASTESGAGRFTEFMLPPLTFEEYLLFIGKDDLVQHDRRKESWHQLSPIEVEEINTEFVNYVNFGGYPEAVISEDIRMDAPRFIKNDIIDKVLLRDLPQLYGITNIQELNNLFTAIAYQTGQEISLESLSKNSGISKPTISKYLEYLEAAFLIFRVRRVDQSAKFLLRERAFKVYLTNPSMRAALFAPLREDSDGFGHIVETAIFSQWFHASNKDHLHYARWSRSGRSKTVMGDHGEIDIVYVSGELKPIWIIEIKWSDSAYQDDRCWHSISEFCTSKYSIKKGSFTSKTIYSSRRVGDVSFDVIPSAVYCYTVGYNTARSRGQMLQESVHTRNDRE